MAFIDLLIKVAFDLVSQIAEHVVDAVHGAIDLARLDAVPIGQPVELDADRRLHIELCLD